MHRPGVGDTFIVLARIERGLGRDAVEGEGPRAGVSKAVRKPPPLCKAGIAKQLPPPREGTDGAGTPPTEEAPPLFHSANNTGCNKTK